MSDYPISPESEDASGENAQFDAGKLERLMYDIKSKQSLPMAILGGLIASVVAAIIWGVVSYATGFQIGFMAIGVGFLVGYAVRFFGKGVTTPFGIVGAVLALLGCILGNLFMASIFLSRLEGSSFLVVFFAFLTSPAIVLEIFKETFSFMDLVFYAIAVYEGYRFSFYELTEAEIASVRTPPPPAPIQTETVKRDE